MRFLVVSQNSVYSHHITSLLHEDGHITDIQDQSLSPLTGLSSYLNDYPVTAVILDFQETSPDIACRLYAEWEYICGSGTGIMAVVTEDKQSLFLNHSLACGVHDAGSDARLLKARLYALVRRKQHFYSDILYVAPVKMDLMRKEFSIYGTKVYLTPFEFRVMEELLRNRERIMSRDILLMHIFHDPPGHNKTLSLNVIIGRLRKKTHPFLKKSNAGIEVIRGIGYRYSSGPSSPAPGTRIRSNRKRYQANSPRTATEAGWRWSIPSLPIALKITSDKTEKVSPRTQWTDPIPVDKFCPHDEACSKASGLTPPR